MALKIESRFSPSVIRGAQITEAIVALASVPFQSPLHAKAHDSMLRLCNDLVGVTQRIAGSAETKGYEMNACLVEMKADRHRLAVERKARRARMQAEREALVFN